MPKDPGVLTKPINFCEKEPKTSNYMRTNQNSDKNPQQTHKTLLHVKKILDRKRSFAFISEFHRFENPRDPD
jgi:hypothetical protein